MESSNPTLVLDNVSKSFGDFRAVSELSLSAMPAGFRTDRPNGAGKTTTIRMIVNITVRIQAALGCLAKP